MDVYVTDVQISDKVHSAGGFNINHYFHRKLTLKSAPLRTFHYCGTHSENFGR